jgi:rhodanese-related sulfurtransferase
MKRFLSIFSTVLIIFILASCGSNSEPTATPVTPSPSPTFTSNITPTPVPTSNSDTDLTIQAAREIFDTQRSNVIMLDVRELSEFYALHIMTAKQIPLAELEKRLGELDNEKTIIVYDNDGSSSLIAKEILLNNGYQHVYNLLGGLVAWNVGGYPVSTIAIHTPSPGETFAPPTPNPFKISPLEAKIILETDKNAVFVDVRAKADYDEEHIPGAICIPSEELESRYSEIPAASQIIVYAGCLG